MQPALGNPILKLRVTVDLAKNRVIRNSLGRILVSRTILWMAFGLMVFHRQALALDTQKAITQFSHRTWGVADHIEEVNAICQTTDGFLWIATINGLFRFDGSAFMQWEPKPGDPGLPGIPNELLGARDGSLWAGGKKPCRSPGRNLRASPV